MEDYAAARADGCTIHVAADAAGIDYKTGRRLETTRELRQRIRELRPAQPTRSPVWFLEMNARNAEIAQERAQRSEKDGDCADLLKAATLALTEGRKCLLEMEGLLQLASVNAGAPMNDEQRSELRKRLSSAPITVTGETVQ